MQPTLIFYPLVAMACLTLIVAIALLKLRYRAVRKDGLSAAYFLLNHGGKPPDYLVKVTQNYDNLFEFPLLFYVVIILIFISGKVTVGYLVLAWLFVASRAVHTYIHTTYNKLSHRRYSFLVSVVLLYCIWGQLTFDLIMG